MTSPTTSSDYLLGSSDKEIQRMSFQHDVWKGPTDAFLDRLGVQKGWRCLDVGAGPGFTTVDLRERVGDEGYVTAVEPSALFAEHLDGIIAQKSWKNVEVIRSTVEEASPDLGQFDLVFVRWVLNFVEDRGKFLAKIAKNATKNGIVAAMDYWYEGLSVYPHGTPFDRLPEIGRSYYRSGGGDAYGIAEMPAILRRNGFDLLEVTPLQLAGGNTSEAFRWMSQFFTEHLPLMAEKGLVSEAERDAQLKNFSDLSQHQEMLCFTPIVLACAMCNIGA